MCSIRLLLLICLFFFCLSQTESFHAILSKLHWSRNYLFYLVGCVFFARVGCCDAMLDCCFNLTLNHNPSRAGKHKYKYKCTNTLYVYCHLCGARESLESMLNKSFVSFSQYRFDENCSGQLQFWFFGFCFISMVGHKLSNFMRIFGQLQLWLSFMIMSDQFGSYVCSCCFFGCCCSRE